MADDSIIVAGGGIGGLATALGLARKGFRATVLEQADRFGEIGAGIQLGPNAFHCFDWLGVGPAARAGAVYIDGLVLMDSHSDDEVCRIPVDEPFRQRFGNPYAVVHRADLHRVLFDACVASDRIELVTGQRVTAYDQDGDSVSVTTAAGTRFTGRALVGADGLRSAVRQQLVGDGEPRVSGHTTYRSVIPTERMPEALRWNAATLWAGRRCHIVHYPLSGWKVFNLVVTFHSDADAPVAGKPVPKSLVRQGFEHIADRPRSLIEAADDWKMWVLCDRDPQERWVDGRVVLLGDAAHPMLQYMAQGACMAMEDAVCLAEMLSRHDGAIGPALGAYAARRLVRTARVQMSSRLMGDYVYHADGPGRLVRNAVLGAKSPAQFYDSLAWLYGGNGLEG
ncbi:MAG: 3-hydroxybenzoate 6-monooxygenase [Pseudomonadota bacterium]|nr:3-hydroxybenzoate 6-monooxygenase [Pseudomonadota bacterium]